MAGYQTELSFKLGTGFGAEEYSQLARMMVFEMGYEDAMQYDLILEKKNGERLVYDIPQTELPTHLNPKTWPDIHQVIFTNHWMKGMNLKIHLVKRNDHASLSLKLDMSDAERRKQLVSQINDQLVASRVETGGNAAARNQERDRLFGAMLLTGSVVQQTRQPFLAGDFKGSLVAARELLEERIEKVFPAVRVKGEKMCEWLVQDPPPLLLPNVSGKSLRRELEGLGHLLTGSILLLDAVARSQEKMPDDPAPALKYLVLVSLLVEKLDSAEVNPLFRKPGTAKKTKVSEKKTVKTTVKKLAKKVAKKVGPAAPQKVKKVTKKK